MTTDNSTEMVDTSTEETSGQEVEDNTSTGTSSATSETEANGQQQEPTAQQDDRLPDSHPLVKAYASTQDQLKQLKGTHQAKVQELEAKVQELSDKATSAETIQAKYDRLEEFLTKVGGPISRALDSRSFSEKLFNSDADVAELVSDWHKTNPSATSSALGSMAAAPGGGKVDINELLRAAAK